MLKKLKQKNFYDIAEGTFGSNIRVYYTIKIPRECKLGDVIPIVFGIVHHPYKISYGRLAVDWIVLLPGSSVCRNVKNGIILLLL